MGFIKMFLFDFSFVYMFTAGFPSCVSIHQKNFKLLQGSWLHVAVEGVVEKQMGFVFDRS